MGKSSLGYEYTPLNTERNEIRLVRLLSTTRKELVSLEIQNYPLHACPDYIALSYTWGDPSATKTILLNSCKFSITQNLESFLRHALRDSDSTWRKLRALASAKYKPTLPYSKKIPATLGWFWVDAVCINQSDILERNRQILRMKDIYERAGRVTIWLGPAGEDSDLAMDRIKYLAEVERGRGRVDQFVGTPFDPKLLGPKGRPFSSNSWIAVSKTSASPMVAKSLDYSRIIYAPEGRLHHSCLLRGHGPRDKIYSILAIATDRSRLELHPDYSIPLLELYRHVAVRSINHYHNLDILSFCARDGTDSQMPSWVPDWSFQAAPAPFPKLTTKEGDRRLYRVYDASRGEIMKVDVATDNKSLMVDGFVFDTVREVSQPKTDDQKKMDLAFSKQWLSLALSGDGAIYIGDQTKFRAFEATICADVNSLRGNPRRNCAPKWFEGYNEENFLSNSFNDCEHLQHILPGRRLIKSCTNLLGLAPMYTEPGDKICILFGSQVPFVLRQEERHWIIIGECYVHGIMDGEACSAAERGRYDTVAFEIW